MGGAYLGNVFVGEILNAQGQPGPLTDAVASDRDDVDARLNHSAYNSASPQEREAATTLLESAEANAANIVEKARQEAQNILSGAEERMKEIECQALEATASAEEEASSIVQRANEEAERIRTDAQATSVVEAKQLVDAELQNAEKEIEALITDCLEKILGKFTPGELVAQVTRNAIENWKDRNSCALKVSSGDVDSVREIFAQHGPELPYPLTQIEVQPDLASGDCCLDAGNQIIKLGLGLQIEEIQRVLKEVFQLPDAQGESEPDPAKNSSNPNDEEAY